MEPKKHLIVYIVASSIFILAALIDLLLPRMFRYCYWDFGLIFAKSFTDIRDFSRENSVTDVIGDACGSLRPSINSICDGVCEHVNDFRMAGVIMTIFTIFSCICSILCIYLHSRVYIDQSLYLNTTSLFMISPFMFYTIGIGTYVGLGGFVSNTVKQKHNSQNFMPKEGLYMAFINFGFCFVIMCYGLLKSRKYISKKVKSNTI